MIENWIVFNDPDDENYVEDDEPLGTRYMDESIIDEYFIFRNIANGNPTDFAYLHNDCSRLEMFRMYAMNLTYQKEKYRRYK